MKIKIVKKKKPVEEDLFSNVKPNSQREKPISSKKKRELEKRDKASRARSTRRRKMRDDVFSASVGGILERIVEEILMELQLLDEAQLEALDEARKRKTIPVCSKANPWHDTLGRFSSKDKARSWSIRTDTKKDGKCSKGQNKTDGSGKRMFTSIKCGRKDHRDSDSPKAKYKCKTGEKVNEEKDEWVKIRKDAFQALLTELDVEPDLLDENAELIKKANARGLYTIKQFLQHIDNLERARDGKLREPSK